MNAQWERLEKRKQRMGEFLGKLVHVVIDRPVGYLHGDISYPVNYGYLPGIMAADGEEQDAYVLGIKEALGSFDGIVIGAVLRKDDVEDKLIVAPQGMEFHQGEIAQAVHFQEQYFDTRILSVLEKSCGVLPYRWANGQREFLLVFESFSQCWSIPKGHMEAGETQEQTALRELYEETGLTAQLDTSRCAAVEYPLIKEYPVSAGARKQVIFYLGQVSGTPRAQPGEIDRYRWVRQEQLQEYLFPDTVRACLSLL